MATKKLSLAQALTYKNRVVEELKRVSDLVTKFNCVVVVRVEDDNKESSKEICRQDVDVEEMMERRHALKGHLIDLKLAIWRASESIRKDILRLAELKDDIVFMSALKTDHGFAQGENRYYDENTKPIEFDAVIQRDDITTALRNYRQEIDEIQSRIDEFNHTTRIEIEDIGV